MKERLKKQKLQLRDEKNMSNKCIQNTKVEKQGRKELEEAYKEIDFRMTGEDTKI